MPDPLWALITIWFFRHEKLCRSKTSEKIKSNYIGFWGGLRYPPKEGDMKRLCNQLSWYLNWFSRSAGPLNPFSFSTVRGLYGSKFWMSPQPLILNSAAAIVPWKYWDLNKWRSILCISLSIILLVRCALGWSYATLYAAIFWRNFLMDTTHSWISLSK